MAESTTSRIIARVHAVACFLLEEIARTPNSGLLSIPEIWWISAGTGHIAKTDVGSLSQTPAQSFRRLSLEDSWAILSMVISGKRLPWEFCSWTIEDLPHSCKASLWGVPSLIQWRGKVSVTESENSTRRVSTVSFWGSVPFRAFCSPISAKCRGTILSHWWRERQTRCF